MLQVGAELLGQGDLAADVEIVRITIALIRAAGLQDFQVNLGHAGVLAPGIAALPDAERADVRRWIDRKDRGSLCRALSGAAGDAASLTVLPFVIGRRDALAGAAGQAPRLAVAGLEHLLALDDALTPDERTHVVYDLGEVRGLEYYTGMHFEVFVAGAGPRGGGRWPLRRADGPLRATDAGRRRLARPRHIAEVPAVSRLRVALAKGRLFEPSVERFRRAGAAPAADAGRRLLIPSSDPTIEFLVVKPGDVPVYVESGAADIGITGTDVLRETGADVLEPLELGFGFCRLSWPRPRTPPTPPSPAASPRGSPPSTLASRRPTSAPRAGRWTSSR